MLRDSPEISPCRFSGKADCTTLTEGVTMTPTPAPIRNSPGAKYQGLGLPRAMTTSAIMPAMATTKPTTMSVHLNGVVVPDHLQVGGHGEGAAQEHRPLHVLGDHAQVRGAVAEQAGRQQNLLAGPFPAANPGEEPGQDDRPGGHQDRHQREV